MKPKFALVQIGKTTNVFIDGKYITNGTGRKDFTCVF